MLISVSSVAFPGAKPAELPMLAYAAGADGLAVTCSDKGSLPLDTSDQDADAFRKQCEDIGVAISALYGYSGRGVLGDSHARSRDVNDAKRCIDLAVRLGCRVVRLFAWKGPSSAPVIDAFVEAVAPISDYAALLGIKIGIPTHHDLAFDPASCHRLIAGLGRDRAEIIFNGQSMELDGIPPVQALRSMLDIIGQVELKDWQRTVSDVTPVPIGSGQATVFPVVRELALNAYGGWLTLHHLRQHHRSLPALEPGVSTMVRNYANQFQGR
jgi:sugar phosphate isomerase/epimerase